MKKIFLIIIFLFTLTSFVVPSKAEAVDWWPIVPCGLNQQPEGATLMDKTPDGKLVPHDYTKPCSRCDTLRFVDNMMKWFMFIFIPIIATIFITIAGLKILVGRGSPGSYGEAKKLFQTTLGGVAIVFGAWLITNAILQTLARDNVSENWWEITCVDDGPPFSSSTSTSTSTSTATSTSTGTSTVTPTPSGNCTGVICKDSSLNVCADNTSASCYESAVNKWDPQILAATRNNIIGSGIDTVALVKAIMSQESGGRVNITSYDGSSHGIMQIQVATANANKQGCTTDNITADWLKTEKNVQASICIAINYVKNSLVQDCGTDIKDIAAGYNGGGAGKGACGLSTSCKSCSVCGTDATRRWECPWDGSDGEHKICNVDRSDTGFSQTRKYAPSVSYCYKKFGGK